MRTSILLCTLLMGWAYCAQAQNTTTAADERTSTWSIGPKVGLNLSHFWGETTDNANMWKPGANGGFFITYSTNRFIGFSAELAYSQKGVRYDIPTVLGANVEGRYRIDYLELPLDARFFLARSGAVRPHISVGPSLAAMLVSRDVMRKPVEETTNINDDINRFDLGVHLGTGLNIKAGSVWINPEVRYTLGLLHVNDSGPNDFRNGALNVGIGIGFPL